MTDFIRFHFGWIRFNQSATTDVETGHIIPVAIKRTSLVETAEPVAEAAAFSMLRRFAGDARAAAAGAFVTGAARPDLSGAQSKAFGPVFQLGPDHLANGCIDPPVEAAYLEKVVVLLAFASLESFEPLPGDEVAVPDQGDD